MTNNHDGYNSVYNHRQRVYTYETRTSNYTRLHKAPLQALPLQKVIDSPDTTQTIRKTIGPERPNVSSSISSPSLRLQVLSTGATTMATQPTSLPEQHGAQVMATTRDFLSLSGFLSAKNPTPKEIGSNRWDALLKEAAGLRVFKRLNLGNPCIRDIVMLPVLADHCTKTSASTFWTIFPGLILKKY